MLLVWKHKGLIALAKAISGDAGIPETWPSERFDVVFVFWLGADGEYGFAQVPQLVLAGDTEGLLLLELIGLRVWPRAGAAGPRAESRPCRMRLGRESLCLYGYKDLS